MPIAQEHSAGDAQCIQLRGEYLYVAEGSKGMRVYDVASIANKGFSEKTHHRAVLAARPGHAHQLEERDLRRAGDDAAGRSGAQRRAS